MFRLFVLAGALFWAGCNSLDPTDPNELHVLFVGNSLTYTNDLPAMVAAFAETEDRGFEYETIAFPNFSLEDHWYQGDARSALASGRWDVVVMQQGPSSLPENQHLLRVWTEHFAEEARQNGIEPALYMVWPSAQFSSSFPSVVESYTLAAEAVNGLLLPAGAAWLAAWERNASLLLYGPDDFHPSETGTYLAALVVYSGLTDTSPIGLPATLDLPTGRLIISASQARELQDAAAEVLAGN
jgi:hypothetical protein